MNRVRMKTEVNTKNSITTLQKLVVVGNGMAAMAAVEAILKITSDISITMFTDEPQSAYNRILLSEVLSGKTPFEKTTLNPRKWYAEHGIDLHLETPVVAIDPAKKIVTDAKGVVTTYDKVILATGGSPTVPPILGRDKENVFVFRTIADTEKIIAAARKNERATIVGGGLLGLEAARALIDYGVLVTVVHLADRLMEQQLDVTGASLLKREMERMGIRILLNTTAEEILGDVHVAGVRLRTEEILPSEMVLLCTGSRPNLTLAAKAGLKIKAGLIVDDRMETSVPGIFAVGDVIEHRGKTYGLVAPLRDQCEVVADSIVGKGERRYFGTVSATTLKVAGISLISAGDFIGGISTEEMVFIDSKRGMYKKCVIRQNRLKGFILLGDTQHGPRLFKTLQKGEAFSAARAALFGNGTGGDKAAAELASEAFYLQDTDLVCTCNNVTKGQIVAVVQEKGLTSRGEVADQTKATTGCGSCAQTVDDLLAELHRPGNSPGVPPTPAIKRSVGGEKSVETSLKTLDLEKIKQEGLGVDFARIKEIGMRALGPEDHYRLKTYGLCTQKHPGYFMLRIRIPGGVLTSKQLAHLADLAETHGRGKAHLTVRQNVELHWVRVEEALEIFEKLETIGLTTRSACGHTMRNVMACPHGAIAPGGMIDMQPWAEHVTNYFLERSDLINPTMPNRLNIFFAGCEECAPHAAINDIGFVTVRRPIADGDQELGFEVWAGGSLGAHPMLGLKLKEFIPLHEALPACQAIFALHTKYGNRNKARSRLKYLIEQWGRERFVAAFEKSLLEKRNLPENREILLPKPNANGKKPLWIKRVKTAIRSVKPSILPSGAVWQKQRGYIRLAIGLTMGEVRAEQLTALARVARRYAEDRVHLTKDQDIELHWVPAHKSKRAIHALHRAGLSLRGEQSEMTVIACPGTEFCTLAVTNAQGAGRELLKRIHPTDQAKASLLKTLSIHLSGCPNSCAKHQVADIGLAGTMATLGESRRFSYQLYLGGRLEGGLRLGEMVRKGITEEMVVPTVEALLDIVLTHRLDGETFREVISRLGTKQVTVLLDTRLTAFLPQGSKPITMVPDFVEVS